MPLLVRQLGIEAVDQVATVARIAFDTAFPWMAGIHTPPEYAGFYRHHVFANCDVRGVETGGTIAGFIALRDGWIEQLYVLPDRQRRGIGKALVAYAKANAPTLSLWCFERNAAGRAFYEHESFVALRTRDGSHNEEREPDVLYRWDAN